MFRYGMRTRGFSNGRCNHLRATFHPSQNRLLRIGSRYSELLLELDHQILQTLFLLLALCFLPKNQLREILCLRTLTFVVGHGSPSEDSGSLFIRQHGCRIQEGGEDGNPTENLGSCERAGPTGFGVLPLVGCMEFAENRFGLWGKSQHLHNFHQTTLGIRCDRGNVFGSALRDFQCNIAGAILKHVENEGRTLFNPCRFDGDECKNNCLGRGWCRNIQIFCENLVVVQWRNGAAIWMQTDFQERGRPLSRWEIP